MGLAALKAASTVETTLEIAPDLVDETGQLADDDRLITQDSASAP